MATVSPLSTVRSGNGQSQEPGTECTAAPELSQLTVGASKFTSCPASSKFIDHSLDKSFSACAFRFIGTIAMQHMRHVSDELSNEININVVGRRSFLVFLHAANHALHH